MRTGGSPPCPAQLPASCNTNEAIALLAASLGGMKPGKHLVRLAVKLTCIAAAAGMSFGPLSLSHTGKSPLLSPRRGTKAGTTESFKRVRRVRFTPMSSLTLQGEHTHRHNATRQWVAATPSERPCFVSDDWLRFEALCRYYFQPVRLPVERCSAQMAVTIPITIP